MEKQEEFIWKGSPSQWTNFWWFLGCITVVLIPVAIWKWLTTKMHQFEITSERIIEKHGVFTRQIDDIELYRVKDIRIEEPFIYRMLGLSNLTIISSDRSLPTLKMSGIVNGMKVREDLRKAVEIRRDEKRAREMDFTGGDGGEVDFD